MVIPFLRRAACPHAADSLNMMCVNGKTRPHPARCATFSPRAKATIGFSSRRSCHKVTDEVKFCGLMSFSVKMFIATKENAPFLNGASVCKIK